MLDVEINIESKIYRLSVPIRPVIDPCAWAGWYLFRFSSHTSLLATRQCTIGKLETPGGHSIFDLK